jgi:beta-glucanase (GH16 family)
MLSTARSSNVMSALFLPVLLLVTHSMSEGKRVANVPNNRILNTHTYRDNTDQFRSPAPAKPTTSCYTQTADHVVKISAHGDEEIPIKTLKSIHPNQIPTTPQKGYKTPDHYRGKKLVWADEFNSEQIDESKWTFETGDGCPNVCGWGNNELEYYQRQNAMQIDGNLIIEARPEHAGGKLYTSSRMVTRSHYSFKYGRVDVRALLPAGQGIWPAIWMLGNAVDQVGWPACGEVDIMEMIGGAGRENTIHGTAHWDNAGTHASYGNPYSLDHGIFADEFHVFSVVWDEHRVVWYVNDVQYNEIDITPSRLNEFRKDFFFIMNVAVGGNWPGNPDDSTTFPQRMRVDYIRVFQDK